VHLLAQLLNPGLIGVVALFLAVLWMLRDEADNGRPWLVFAIALNLFFGFLTTIVMGREGGLFPWKYDYVLVHLDETLGVSAAALAKPLQGASRIPLAVVYQLMVPMMILWLTVTRRWLVRGSVVLAYVAELVAGPVTYAILPACGPIYAFGQQWLHPPAVPAGAVRLIGMPNAFPSLHVGTALVLVLMAPGRVWRGISLTFLAGTILATLSTGEHYVIDLVSGLAFGCFATSVGYRRLRQAIFYLGVVVSWSAAGRLAYRFLIDHTGLLRLLVGLTVALAIYQIIKEWSVRGFPAVAFAMVSAE
jgi:hypothetical protein